MRNWKKSVSKWILIENQTNSVSNSISIKENEKFSWKIDKLSSFNSIIFQFFHEKLKEKSSLNKIFKKKFSFVLDFHKTKWISDKFNLQLNYFQFFSWETAKKNQA